MRKFDVAKKGSYFFEQKLTQILQNSRNLSAAKYNPSKIVEIGCIVLRCFRDCKNGLYGRVWKNKSFYFCGSNA